MSIYLDIKGVSVFMEVLERGGDRYSDPWTISSQKIIGD